MTTELRKRLEEAADGIYPVSEIYNDLAMEFVDANGGLREAFQDGGEVGAELGYKEAVAKAKEWIRKRNRHACKEWLDKECADFEADMNKLWEEQK